MNEIPREEPLQSGEKFKITTGYGEFDSPSKEQKGIAVTEDFRNLLKEHPHAIATILSLMGKITKDQLSVAEGDVKLSQFYTVVDPKKRTGLQTSNIYKIEIGNQAFFMKTQNKEFSNRFGGGLHEFESRTKLKELLKDIPGVEVLDYKLGYTGKKNKYFVSTWVEHTDNIVEADRFANVDYKLHPRESQKLSMRIQKISNMLINFFELDVQNCLYDIKNDIIIIHDVQLIKQEWREVGVQSSSLYDSAFINKDVSNG